MKNKLIYMAAAAYLLLSASCVSRPAESEPAGHEPILKPELSGVTLPDNIAAPTFMINEKADNYYVEIGIPGEDPAIVEAGSTAVVRPTLDKWHSLLKDAAGREISIKVFTETDGKWKQFDDVRCNISDQPIDEYLVYRLIYPGYQIWNEVGIYQRNLTNYTETAVLENQSIGTDHCVNCHSFAGGAPETMMIHVRGKNGGTLLRRNGETIRIDPKCPDLENGATYPSWHPSGKYIAFSANKIRQFFHTSGTKTIEVSDLEADMILYDVEKGKSEPIPGLNGKEWMETFPTWSPDGRTLYFCRAAEYIQPEPLDSIRYGLCRISFDEKTGAWGDVETVIDAPAEGHSISFPRVSPDGRYLLYTLSDYGNFSIWHPESDLWLLDQTTGKTRVLDEINSSDVESYHSWSSNGRWIVFSSKRMDGLWARPYIASFDPATGKAGKPFVLPQSDPLFYDSFMKTYNIPELAQREITDTEAFTEAVNK